MKSPKKKIDYSRGNTLTGRSIEFAMEEAFTPLYGSRKDEDAVQKILIVLTDGRYVERFNLILGWVTLVMISGWCCHLSACDCDLGSGLNDENRSID